MALQKSESLKPPYELFKGATCRGSYALGSACGHCERCEWERSVTKAINQDETAAAKSTAPEPTVEEMDARALDPEQEAVNIDVYNTARAIDKILHRKSIETHISVLGILQLTTERRAHEHKVQTQRKQQEAQEAARKQHEEEQEAARARAKLLV